MENLKADGYERGQWCIGYSQYAALGASAIVSFISLKWILFRSEHGIDLTDESFYILWLSNPWIYDASLSHFGFIYHPLYKLVGGDIVLLRKANALIFFALAFGLGTVLFEKILSAGASKTSGFRPVRRSVIIGLSFAFSSTSLLGFLPWLPTPSYNTLGLQALLLAGIGVLLAEREVSWRSVAGWCLLGAAGWLSFMAKPSSAAALGFTVGIYLLLAGKFQIKLVLLGALTAVSLLMASAWAIDGSVAGFVERLRKGLELYKHLTTGHPRQNVFRLGQFGLTWEDGKILTAGLVFLVGSVIMLQWRIAPRLVFISALLVCGVSIAMALEFVDFVAVYRWLGAKVITHKSLGTRSIAIVPIGVIIAYIVCAGLRLVPSFRGGLFALILFFLLLPYVYVIGSTHNYWFIGPMAGIFWVAAGLLLLIAIPAGQKSWGILIPVIVTGQFMTIAATAITMEFPYRQIQPLQRNQIVLPLRTEDSALKLSPELADYALTLMHIAESKGFRSGDPLLDFTGQAPGAAVVLGAKAVGQPWLLGGYRGSRAFVDVTLNGVDCDVIARAWILAGPSNRRALPLDILERHGVYVEHQYEVVGTVLAHDQDRNTSYKQVLYRPSRSPEVAKLACEGKRRLAPPSQHVNNSGAHNLDF